MAAGSVRWGCLTHPYGVLALVQQTQTMYRAPSAWATRSGFVGRRVARSGWCAKYQPNQEQANDVSFRLDCPFASARPLPGDLGTAQGHFHLSQVRPSPFVLRSYGTGDGAADPHARRGFGSEDRVDPGPALRPLRPRAQDASPLGAGLRLELD